MHQALANGCAPSMNAAPASDPPRWERRRVAALHYARTRSLRRFRLRAKSRSWTAIAIVRRSVGQTVPEMPTLYYGGYDSSIDFVLESQSDPL